MTVVEYERWVIWAQWAKVANPDIAKTHTLDEWFNLPYKIRQKILRIR